MSQAPASRITVLALAITVMTSHGAVRAQSNANPGPVFEAVSVKRSASSDGAFLPPRFKGTLMTAQNVPIEILIMVAYGVRATELVGGPSWIRDLSGERYDIIATASAAGPRDEQLAMLRHMLEDRFALRVHRDTREMPVYLLTRPDGHRELGPNLKRASKECPTRESCEMQTTIGRLMARGAQWSLVQQAIASPLDRRLIDRTGLSGAFDVDLTYSQGLSPDPREPTGDIFAAVREQLGLSLQPGRAPLEVTVIDSISRPTPN